MDTRRVIVRKHGNTGGGKLTLVVALMLEYCISKTHLSKAVSHDFINNNENIK